MRVLVVGCGRMGSSHARAYQKIEGFEIAGLVSRHPESREALNQSLGGGIALFSSYEDALDAVRPEVVSINTYPDTHAAYTLQALQAGAHVFLEKPLAVTVEDAQAVVAAANQAGRKLLVGNIFRHHPSWIRFIELARTLGKPLVMRMNLNQQSSGPTWAAHRSLLETTSPLVDCGVQYVDVMCQLTGARPLRVSAIGANLSGEIDPAMYNYGQLQVVFDDGSVGWYEAGWGPMISETATFVKDVIGPLGSVSISGGSGLRSDDLRGHTQPERLLLHPAETDGSGRFAQADRVYDLSGEPGHDELCEREQRFLLRAIREDLDLSTQLADAVTSLRIVLAADQSVRSGKVVSL